MGEERHTHEKQLEDTSSDITNEIIQHTEERITQELSNVSADELKANVLSATAVVFSILSVSEYLRSFQTIAKELTSITIVFFLMTLILLSIAFFFGIKVLYPRKNRFNLWKPRESNNDYAERQLNVDTIRKERKKELIESFESIEESRVKDSSYIKWGYVFLISGSMIILITLSIIKMI